LNQFLIESMTMSGLGGLLGIAFGFAGAGAIRLIFDFPAAVSSGSVLLAVSFSCGVGVFFGYYPARRAARLRPIDALRYE
jgi:putative ABC transport system permease protein